MLEDWYWLCEHLQNNTRNHLTRAKRENEKKVSSLKDQAEQSSLARDNYVPREHRLWNGAEKFFHAVMMEGVKEELRGLKLTALQDRLILDQLTASPGGGACTCGNCIQNMTNAIHRLTAREVNANDD